DVVNTSMEGALRVISVERGYEPSDFTLVAFGGAAGLHACELAQRLGVPRVLVPPSPGVLSAFGMLVAPVRKQTARTVLARGCALTDFALDETFDALAAEACAELMDEDVARGHIIVRRSVDARYRGQSYELTVSADGDWVRSFHDAHARRFGHARPGAEVEAVTLRVEAEAAAPLDETAAAFPVEGALELPATTHIVFDGAGMEARLIARGNAPAGVEGPAVVVEYSATTLIPPGWRIDRAVSGALLLGRSDSAMPCARRWRTCSLRGFRAGAGRACGFLGREPDGAGSDRAVRARCGDGECVSCALPGCGPDDTRCLAALCLDAGRDHLVLGHERVHRDGAHARHPAPA